MHSAGYIAGAGDYIAQQDGCEHQAVGDAKHRAIKDIAQGVEGRGRPCARLASKCFRLFFRRVRRSWMFANKGVWSALGFLEKDTVFLVMSTLQQFLDEGTDFSCRSAFGFGFQHRQAGGGAFGKHHPLPDGRGR